ncbi:hypothetical protein SHKM778_04360 [Streptomyces sp. KM77-8]|uniref:ChrR-like cupin domain-containing protein n=1 Tax=Streptomyces haneummycinicus TaxID=3074435 RepID=A0AAT9H9G6_9ACTN
MTLKETGKGGPAAAILRYLPGCEAPVHRHPGYEMIYVLSDEMKTDDDTYEAGSRGQA